MVKSGKHHEIISSFEAFCRNFRTTLFQATKETKSDFISGMNRRGQFNIYLFHQVYNLDSFCWFKKL